MIEEAVEKNRLVRPQAVGLVLDTQFDNSTQDVAELVNVLVQAHHVNVVALFGRDANQLALVVPGDPALLQPLVGPIQTCGLLDFGRPSLDQTPLDKA